MGQAETRITKQIIDLINSHPHAVAHKIHQTGGTQAGVPDIVACHRGRALWIEVKTDDGIISRIQKWQMDKLRSAGAIVLVATSTADVQGLLDELEDR